MLDGVYHCDVWMPHELRQATLGLRPVPLIHSGHARRAAADDGVRLPNVLQLSSWKLVEVEVRGGCAVKLVVRKRYDAARDLVLVVLANGVVKTTWMNQRSDNHRTLNRSAYVQPGGHHESAH